MLESTTIRSETLQISQLNPCAAVFHCVITPKDKTRQKKEIHSVRIPLVECISIDTQCISPDKMRTDNTEPEVALTDAK